MDNANHRFNELFAQLGLPNDAAGIAEFLTAHAGIAAQLRLPDAPCWNPAQAQFLRESLHQDSDWTDLADRLSQALQAAPDAPPVGLSTTHSPHTTP